MQLDVDYTEYLGPDWKPSFDNAGIIICNHQTFLDIIINMVRQGEPSHISKVFVKQVPFIGTIATAVGSLFVDRANKENKK